MPLTLAATALTASPLLWLLHDGTISADRAALRLLACLLACWTVLEAAAGLVLAGEPRVVPEPAPHPDAGGVPAAPDLAPQP